MAFLTHSLHTPCCFSIWILHNLYIFACRTCPKMNCMLMVSRCCGTSGEITDDRAWAAGSATDGAWGMDFARSALLFFWCRWKWWDRVVYPGDEVVKQVFIAYWVWNMNRHKDIDGDVIVGSYSKVVSNDFSTKFKCERQGTWWNIFTYLESLKTTWQI